MGEYFDLINQSSFIRKLLIEINEVINERFINNNVISFNLFVSAGLSLTKHSFKSQAKRLHSKIVCRKVSFFSW